MVLCQSERSQHKNRRVKKDLDTGTDVIYLYGGWQVLEEREWDTNGEGAEDDKWEPRRQYVYGATYIDEVLIFDKDTDDDGDCVDGGGSSRRFYCQQANWNVIAVTDSSGDTDEKINYAPYGEATVTVQGGHSATGNPYLFQSRRWDTEVDLYYFRNRVMSPVLGRFLQRDPAKYADGINLYQYGKSNPTSRVDPHGTWSCDSSGIKGFCKCIIWIPPAAQALECGWCNGCLTSCVRNCLIDTPEVDCPMVCAAAHASCLAMCVFGKCTFWFSVAG